MAFLRIYTVLCALLFIVSFLLVRCVKQHDKLSKYMATLSIGHENLVVEPSYAQYQHDSFPFTGSVVTQHEGVAIYENVCLVSKKQLRKLDHRGRMLRSNDIYSYTGDEKLIGHSIVSWARWLGWSTRTKGKSLQDWKQDSKEYLVEDETLLMLGWHNAAHCLTDELFSIAVDIVSRKLQRNGTQGAFYPKYFRAKRFVLHENDWCSRFHALLGVVSSPIRPPPDGEPICFRKLIVPHFAAYRHPSSDQFMQHVLEMVQGMASNVTGLDVDPWKQHDLALDAKVLLYDRKGTGSRMLKNSASIKRLIEERYHAKVELMGETWNDIVDEGNITSQASVYNRFPYVISPHGAQLTNLLFARKGTCVMEIACWAPNAPLPHGELFLNLTGSHEAENEQQWYGEPSPLARHKWFYNFTRRLGIEHFVYSEYDGCKNNGKLSKQGKPPEIRVDEERFVSFIASRFNLKSRIGRSQSSQVFVSNTNGTNGSSKEEEMNAYREIDPRPFIRWDKPLPCFSPEKDWLSSNTEQSPTREGFIFIKTPKAGSSTGSGITLQIASNVARRHGLQEEICKNRVGHFPARRRSVKNRVRDKSFLWSVVRDPTARAISEFFHFQVARNGTDPTDDNFIRFLNGTKLLRDKQLRYLALGTIQQKDANKLNAAKTILKEYDFVATTERMDESTVALSMLLGLETAEVMSLSNAKSSGGYDDGEYQNTCFRIPKPVVSTRVRQYLQSKQWKDIVRWDELLHRAVNKSLDMTIENLGIVEFQSKLKVYRREKEEIATFCSGKVLFPCSSTGVPINDTDCISGDMGCGFACMDEYYRLQALSARRNETKTSFHFLGNPQKNKRKRRAIEPSSESLNISNLTLKERTELAHSLRQRAPIFAAGLPKTGTSSLHGYFSSVRVDGIFHSSHTFSPSQNGQRVRAGACMQKQYMRKEPMLQTCGPYQSWVDSGYALKGDCFYPLWHALDEFVENYPTATIILNTRNATAWTNSIQKWGEGRLANWWITCNNGLSPTLPRTLEKKEWMDFYELYHERIRQACKQQVSLRCIEFDIGDSNAGNILEKEFGIPAAHWLNCDPYDWSCKNHATLNGTNNVTVL